MKYIYNQSFYPLNLTDYILLLWSLYLTQSSYSYKALNINNILFTNSII